MPIIKTGPRITHMYRQLKSGEPPAFDNDDLSIVGDTAAIKITMPVSEKEDAQLRPGISRYLNGKVVFGYRPFWRFCLGSGFFLSVFAAIGVLGSFLDKSLSDFFIAMGFLLLGLGMMWHGGFSAYRHFVIFDRANGLVHISNRLRWWKYSSLRWEDIAVVNGHWLLPGGWSMKPRPTYDIKILLPPMTLPRLGVISYQLNGVSIYAGETITTDSSVNCANSDPTWRHIVLFMCHGPEHHPIMQDYIDREYRIRDHFHQGSWEAMLESDMKDLSPWLRWMKRFRMPDLPDTPTHVLDDNGKWRKLKECERAAHKTGPRWKHIKPEHDAILR